MSGKILIVDDDQELLEELTEALQMSGYDVVAVHDPVAAAGVVLRAQPALILLDLKMPGKSGFLLADEIRHMAGMESVPIIAMSAFFKEDFTSLLRLCDIKKCLKKPIPLTQLIQEIKEALQENPSENNKV